MEQKILRPEGNYRELDAYFRESGARRLFLVCGSSIRKLRVGRYFDTLAERTGIETVRFSGFLPNPRYEEAVRALECYRESGCNAIAAVGGGSAMDVAKCVKLWADMGPRQSYLEQAPVPNRIPFLAVPTTAGTGSEATRFAVIYRGGEKRSVSHGSGIPGAVLLDPTALESLPDYHRKSSMLDALCHGIESFWSLRADAESREISRQALERLRENWNGYIQNTPAGNAGMLEAAHLAGRAIDRTQTTAGHAMCYKLTALYRIAHGHAAGLCVRALWPYMAERAAGTELEAVFQALAEAFGCADTGEALGEYERLWERLGLETPEPEAGDLEILKHSVNAERLKNNPIPLDMETIDRLYRRILHREAEA